MNKKQKKSLKRIVLSAVFLFAASILSPLAESAFIKIFLFIIPYFGPVGAGEFLVIVYEF